jgi:hypothetical protein
MTGTERINKLDAIEKEIKKQEEIYRSENCTLEEELAAYKRKRELQNEKRKVLLVD